MGAIMPIQTSRLASHIVAYRDADITPTGLTVAKQCVMDWFGVTLAGTREPVAGILRDEILPHARGPSSVLGADRRCAPADAALINGTTSHALDYDDVHPLIGHPTAAILPAALAVGEAEGQSGMQVLRAFIAGYETAGYIGSVVFRSHYERGFHSTATLGSFGAAAAAGLLMNLNAAQMAIAIGLAGTQAAGLKCMFGTMAKPFHAGRAAANGVLAARLAARGFTASPNVLEAEQGFIRTQSDADPDAQMLFPQRCSLVVQTLFKYHAACYLTHATIEAVTLLRKRLSLHAPDVASIEVHVPPGHLSVCNIAAPQTGLETKFSLRHVAALAVIGRNTAAIETFSDVGAIDPEITAIRERVTVHGDRQAGDGAYVAIKRRGGSIAETTFDAGNPEGNLDYQGERLTTKFRSLAIPVLGSERAERLRHSIGLSETLDHIGLLANA